MSFLIKIGYILIIIFYANSKEIIEEYNNMNFLILKNKYKNIETNRNSSLNLEINRNIQKIEQFPFNEEIKYLPSNCEVLYEEVYYNITIDLIVLSGDAFFILDNQAKNWTTDIFNFGNNQKLILRSLIKDNKYNFKIKANKEGAIYKILFGKANLPSQYWPIKICAIEENNRKKNQILRFNVSDNDYIENGERIGIFINLIDCNGDIDFINDIITVDKNNLLIEYNVIDIDEVYENKVCLFFFGSVNLDLNTSFLTLPEGNSLKFKLNESIKIIRTNFYYAYSTVEPELYLRIFLYKNTLIKVNIQIIDEKNIIFHEISYEIWQTKNILVFDSHKSKELDIRKDIIYEIRIIFEKIGEIGEEAIFDINIKTSNNFLNIIKTREVNSDIIFNNRKNNINYYYTNIIWNTYGYVKLNFKRGKGYMYGKLINIKKNPEEGGWNNKITLPDDKSNNLLKFDFYEQKIYFDQTFTDKCGKYCYLIIGVKRTDNYLSNYTENMNYEIFSEYNIIFRYFEDITNLNINYLNIQNYQYIFNSISYKDKIEYYKYYFKDKKEDELFIEFKSYNCKLDFKNAIVEYEESKGNNIKIKLSKKEINNEFISIGISKIEDIIDINEVNLVYQLRIIEPNNLFKNIIKIETDHPIFYNLVNSEIDYCDYLLALDNIYIKNTIVEIITQELNHINNNQMLYLNIMDSNEFKEIIKQNKLPNWPDKNNSNSSSNYINLSINNYFESLNSIKIKNVADLILLIRVYTNSNSLIELHTYIHNNINNDIIPIFPFSNEFQYFSCYSDNKLELIIPDEEYYYLQFVSINKEAYIRIDNRTIPIEKGLIFNNLSNKRIIIESKKDNISSDLKDREKEEKYTSSYYSFYIFFKKNLKDNYKNAEKIKSNVRYKFYYGRNFPISYLIDITYSNINNDLYYYIYFSNLTFNNIIDESYNNNYTESFMLKAVLTNYDNFYLDNSENYQQEFLGKYDKIYHGGRIIIPYLNISNYKKNSENSVFIQIIIEISHENKRKYNFVEGNLFLIEEKNIRENIPKNTYITNSFKPQDNKRIHIYKLNEYSNSEINKIKKIYLSTISKNISFYLSKNSSNYLSNENKINYQLIRDINQIGKYEIMISDLIKEIYLIIECQQKNYETDYSFKYFSTDSEIGFLKNLYDNNIIAEKSSGYSTSFNLKINKIQFLENYIKINYYIRIYEDRNNSLGDLNISTSFRTKNPYLIYKIKYNESIINNKNETYFELNVKTDIYQKYFIDAIAEVIYSLDNQYIDYYAYNKLYPLTNNYKKDNKESKTLIIVIILVIFLFSIFIIILISLAWKFRNKHINLENKVKRVSFKGDSRISKNDYLF